MSAPCTAQELLDTILERCRERNHLEQQVTELQSYGTAVLQRARAAEQEILCRVFRAKARQQLRGATP